MQLVAGNPLDSYNDASSTSFKASRDTFSELIVVCLHWQHDQALLLVKG